MKADKGYLSRGEGRPPGPPCNADLYRTMRDIGYMLFDAQRDWECFKTKSITALIPPVRPSTGSWPPHCQIVREWLNSVTEGRSQEEAVQAFRRTGYGPGNVAVFLMAAIGRIETNDDLDALATCALAWYYPSKVYGLIHDSGNEEVIQKYVDLSWGSGFGLLRATMLMTVRAWFGTTEQLLERVRWITSCAQSALIWTPRIDSEILHVFERLLSTCLEWIEPCVQLKAALLAHMVNSAHNNGPSSQKSEIHEKALEGLAMAVTRCQSFLAASQCEISPGIKLCAAIPDEVPQTLFEYGYWFNRICPEVNHPFGGAHHIGGVYFETVQEAYVECIKAFHAAIQAWFQCCHRMRLYKDLRMLVLRHLLPLKVAWYPYRTTDFARNIPRVSIKEIFGGGVGKPVWTVK